MGHHDPLPVPRTEILRIAADAGVDPRTVIRTLRTHCLPRGMVGERLAPVLSRYGFELGEEAE